MATARMSIGSIFGTIGQTANTLTTSLEAVNAGIGMANQAIQSMAIQQKVRAELGDESFEEMVLVEKSKELADVTLGAAKFRSQSEQHAQAYDAAFAKLSAVLAKRKKS